MNPPARDYGPLTEPQRELCRLNLGLAYYIARIRYRPRIALDECDLLELAFIGLCKGAQHYDPSRGKFSTIACRAMHSEINDKLAAMRRKKRTPTGHMLRLSLDPS